MRPNTYGKLMANAKENEFGCLIWQKSVVIPGGYAKANMWNKTILVHRYVAIYNSFSDEERQEDLVIKKYNSSCVVCHTCDTPPCINPEHLIIADHRYNTQDSIRKGRMHGRMGEDSNWAKISNEDAIAIINEAKGTKYISQAVLGRKYGISQQQVSRILAGTRWMYLQ